MCECGCSSSHQRYSFPGPGKTFYLLTLAGACTNCCAPSGVSIEHIKPGMFLYDHSHREEFIDGKLTFEEWSDTEGVAIVTGMEKHEFVKALAKHLIGVSAKDMGEDGTIDAIGAEVILEEAYDDSLVTPHFPKAVTSQ